MRLKIRCDGKSEKFYKFFLELNKALEPPGQPPSPPLPTPLGRLGWPSSCRRPHPPSPLLPLRQQVVDNTSTAHPNGGGGVFLA